MRASQFLREYEDLGQEKKNIIQTISGLDANTPEQAALLDRIWKLLNSQTFGSNINKSFVATTADEYMNEKTLETHRRNVAEIISRLDSDYSALSGFLKKLEGGGAIDISALSQPVNTFNAVFGGDAVAIKAFNALKGYGVGERQKGPGEFALAMMSSKIRLAQGEGDTEIDGVGKVEVKAAMGSKGSGGRLGHGGPNAEAQMNSIIKYEKVIPNLVAGIRAKRGGTISLGVFCDAMDAELPVNGKNELGNNNDVRGGMMSALLQPVFGNGPAQAIANVFSNNEGREATENEYIKQNFEWYKTRDNFDAYLLISFTFGKTAMGKTGDDIIKMKKAGMLGTSGISIVPSKAAPREVFAQISLNAAGI